MTQSNNLPSHQASALAVAELRSPNGESVFRICFMGYEFETPQNSVDSDWYRIIFEYADSKRRFENKTCSFDSRSIRSAIDAVRNYSAINDSAQVILEPPYGNDFVMSFAYKKGHLKKRAWIPFFRDRQGVFVRLSFRFGPQVSNAFDVQFKVDRAGILNFQRGLQMAANTLPIRDNERAKRLGRIKGVQ